MSGHDWEKYHQERAARMRKTAEQYRESAKVFIEHDDTRTAAFCLSRAQVNESWANEQDAFAQQFCHAPRLI